MSHILIEAKKRELKKNEDLVEKGIPVYFKLVLASILKLVQNKKWMLLATSGGLTIGTFFTFLTLLNQIIKPTFTDQSDPNGLNILIGKMNFTMLLVGFGGSTIVGIILDKTKMFKRITLLNTMIFSLIFLSFTYFVLKGLYFWTDC